MWQFFLYSLLVLFVSREESYAANFPVNSYSTLTSRLSAAADGDTLNLTDNIVVSAEVVLAKSIVFQGNGYTISVPAPGLNDAGIYNASPSAFRVFNINTTGKTVVFNRLTIKGGYTASAVGAAVSVSSGVTALFINCVIADSKGPDANGGGGIYSAGTCYLYLSEITRNASGFAGGFLNAGLMFIQYSTVTENRSLCSGCGGGGVNYGTGATLYVNNSSFSNNQSSELGGAFENYGSSTGAAYFVNTSFTGNVAFNSATTLKGGAVVQHAAGSTNLVNCLFAYNYWNSSGTAAPSSYQLNDVHAYSGTLNMYYTTYVASTTYNGTINSVIGNTGFTNGNGSPVIGYKNMTTNAWVNLVGNGASAYPVNDDKLLRQGRRFPQQERSKRS